MGNSDKESTKKKITNNEFQITNIEVKEKSR
jgi:hypothetical protein